MAHSEGGKEFLFLFLPFRDTVQHILLNRYPTFAKKNVRLSKIMFIESARDTAYKKGTDFS